MDSKRLEWGAGRARGMEWMMQEVERIGKE
jgi:hypothetical protein